MLRRSVEGDLTESVCPAPLFGLCHPVGHARAIGQLGVGFSAIVDQRHGRDRNLGVAGIEGTYAIRMKRVEGVRGYRRCRDRVESGYRQCCRSGDRRRPFHQPHRFSPCSARARQWMSSRKEEERRRRGSRQTKHDAISFSQITAGFQWRDAYRI